MIVEGFQQLSRKTLHDNGEPYSPAETMSAVSGDSAHLTRWAQAAGIAPSEFLARRDYGRYLRDLLTGAERAAQSVVRLSRVSAEVVAVRQVTAKRPLRLRLGNGRAHRRRLRRPGHR